MRRVVMSLGASVSLLGCTVVGPDYVTPAVSIQDQFYQRSAVSNPDAAYEQWWTLFQDRLMSRLIWHGVADNLDIAAAMERLREANFNVERFGPASQANGNLNASAERQRVGNTTTNVRSATVSASFLFDIFGAVRRSQEQATALAEAQAFGIGTVRLAVLSQIAESYIQIRFFQQAGAITTKTINSRRRLLGLVQDRLNAEAATRLELEQARALLRTAEAGLPAQQAGFEANAFRIATLLATTSDPVIAMLKGGRPQPIPKGKLNAGIPADLLRNRPDVRRAERELAAASAAIGIAEADLYPSVQLGGSIRFGDNEAWNFGPSLTVPILGRPVLKANRKVAESRFKQAEIAWRQTILTAVEEVQAAQSRCLHLSRQVVALRSAISSSRQVLSLSRESYRLGETLLTDVLDAEIALSNTDLQLAAAQRDLAISWVSLQVAAGKGWGVVAPSEEELGGKLAKAE